MTSSIYEFTKLYTPNYDFTEMQVPQIMASPKYDFTELLLRRNMNITIVYSYILFAFFSVNTKLKHHRIIDSNRKRRESYVRWTAMVVPLSEWN